MKEMKPQYIYKATVTKVVDGDTVDLLVDCGFNIIRKERIRFYGVDAPDTNYEDHEFMRMALRRDVVAICEDCTAIYMMSNWERSKGANAELALAKALGLDVYYEAPLPKVKKELK